MAIIAHDFVECQCGSVTFTEQSICMFHRAIKERSNKEEPLAAIKKAVVYKCTECGKTLDK